MDTSAQNLLDGSKVSARGSFRWRLIPVTILFLTGTLTVLGSVFAAGLVAFFNLQYGWIIPDPVNPTRNQIAVTPENVTRIQLMFWSGTAAVISGYACLRGRWRVAMGTAGLWFVLTFVQVNFFPMK